ncbi:MAG TPA: DUF4190 domain-containing protein, partial [Oscillospiraceae bacterium]|nr:DUF4190 domain-containing protein [Oscillospiraceae bacterium]
AGRDPYMQGQYSGQNMQYQQPPVYGQDPYPQQMGPAPIQPPQPVKSSGKAVASLVLSILSLIMSIFAATLVIGILGFLLGIVAVVLGVMGRKDVAQSQGQVGGSGMATAGLIMGIIGIIVNLVVVVACLACYGWLSKEVTEFDWAWDLIE